MSFGALLAAARLFMGGLLSKLAVFVRANPWRAVALAALIAVLCLRLQLTHEREFSAAQTTRAAEAQARFVAEKAEFYKLVDKFKAARKDAARLDRLNKERVRQETASILERVQYEADLERDRALADLRDRLHLDGQKGSDGVECRSGGGTTRLPVLSVLPAGAMLPERAAIVGARDAEICTINTLGFERLKAAWQGVAGVDVNNAPKTDNPPPP